MEKLLFVSRIKVFPKEKGGFLNFFLNFISSYKATTTSVAVSYVHVTPP